NLKHRQIFMQFDISKDLLTENVRAILQSKFFFIMRIAASYSKVKFSDGTASSHEMASSSSQVNTYPLSFSFLRISSLFSREFRFTTERSAHRLAIISIKKMGFAGDSSLAPTPTLKSRILVRTAKASLSSDL